MSTSDKEDQNIEDSFDNEHVSHPDDNICTEKNSDSTSLQFLEVNTEIQDEGDCTIVETPAETENGKKIEIDSTNYSNDEITELEINETSDQLGEEMADNTSLDIEPKSDGIVNCDKETEETTVDIPQNCVNLEEYVNDNDATIEVKSQNVEHNVEKCLDINVNKEPDTINTPNDDFCDETNDNYNKTNELEDKNDLVDIQESENAVNLNLEDETSKEIKNTINDYQSQNNDRDIKSLSSNLEAENNSYCDMCNKIVYSMEKLTTNDRIFHKTCFRCSKCKSALSSGNFTFNNGKPFCTTHYLEMFKKRGRYDEVDYNNTETEIPTSTDINDLLTDELPAPDTTRNMLAKFRDLQAGIVQNVNQSVVIESSDEMPPPNTTKMLMEHFKTIGQEKSEPKCKPKIEIHSISNGHSNGTYENEPVILPGDVVRANDPGQDDRPDQGFTKNLLNRFRELENMSNN